MSSPSPLLTVNPTSLSAMPAVRTPPSITLPGPSSNHIRLTRTSSPPSPPAASAKRRRMDKDSATDTDPSPSTGTGPIRTARKDNGPRKKKAARACIHCQRAHLTCDDCACPLVSIWLIFADRMRMPSPSLPALYQAWNGRLLRRGSSETREISVG
jgi:hypothetical protein